jgi:exopolyphosphatase/guanosine-5'-triphosphate,3'-diphosphate pyrophosphatase
VDANRKRRTAVIDLGSNSFRLVVFTSVANAWWRRTDEIYEPVRIGAGMGDGGPLKPKRVERALHTIEMYAHFLRASGLEADDVRAVATSAIREAANRDEFLARAREVAGFEIQVLSREEEAGYGYLAAVNSTTLDHGAVLDLGGGSLQAVRVDRRLAQESASWRLGTVRMTEAFLGDEPATKKQLKALRAHVQEELAGAPWLGTSGERLVGLGGTARNLAAAAQHRAGLPSFGVQGFVLERDALAELTADLAAMPAAERGSLRGVKPERGDVILAGAATIEAVMDAGGFEAMEVTEEGLREGIFFEAYLAPADPPLFASVREASVRNLATQHHGDLRHQRHVAALTLQLYDSLAAAGAHPGGAADRELVWAAALLHDVGYAVDYDDHHKHSRYLILNAGLPGWTPREVALIALMARYHRKGNPSFGELAPLMVEGDEELLARAAALLRLAEQLERSRDQLVREARVEVHDGTVRLQLVADGDVSVARWGAQRQSELFESAFGRRLEVDAP